eukprot:TRINITY_DN8588_c0_g2_i2.p1 TRINITY_DN8588_c0_g2~~TRINITY_DN8588_c0_g2_i2.p1  ORF type:complete len:921 (+),score=74.75 TRINITY_DN8588_c0_g2_i2:76-2838(+)
MALQAWEPPPRTAEVCSDEDAPQPRRPPQRVRGDSAQAGQQLSRRWSSRSSLRSFRDTVPTGRVPPEGRSDAVSAPQPRPQLQPRPQPPPAAAFPGPGKPRELIRSPSGRSTGTRRSASGSSAPSARPPSRSRSPGAGNPLSRPLRAPPSARPAPGAPAGSAEGWRQRKGSVPESPPAPAVAPRPVPPPQPPTAGHHSSSSCCSSSSSSSGRGSPQRSSASSAQRVADTTPGQPPTRSSGRQAVISRGSSHRSRPPAAAAQPAAADPLVARQLAEYAARSVTLTEALSGAAEPPAPEQPAAEGPAATPPTAAMRAAAAVGPQGAASPTDPRDTRSLRDAAAASPLPPTPLERPLLAQGAVSVARDDALCTAAAAALLVTAAATGAVLGTQEVAQEELAAAMAAACGAAVACIVAMLPCGAAAWTAPGQGSSAAQARCRELAALLAACAAEMAALGNVGSSDAACAAPQRETPLASASGMQVFGDCSPRWPLLGSQSEHRSMPPHHPCGGGVVSVATSLAPAAELECARREHCVASELKRAKRRELATLGGLAAQGCYAAPPVSRAQCTQSSHRPTAAPVPGASRSTDSFSEADEWTPTPTFPPTPRANSGGHPVPSQAARRRRESAHLSGVRCRSPGGYAAGSRAGQRPSSARSGGNAQRAAWASCAAEPTIDRGRRSSGSADCSGLLRLYDVLGGEGLTVARARVQAQRLAAAAARCPGGAAAAARLSRLAAGVVVPALLRAAADRRCTSGGVAEEPHSFAEFAEALREYARGARCRAPTEKAARRAARGGAFRSVSQPAPRLAPPRTRECRAPRQPPPAPCTPRTPRTNGSSSPARREEGASAGEQVHRARRPPALAGRCTPPRRSPSASPRKTRSTPAAARRTALLDQMELRMGLLERRLYGASTGAPLPRQRSNCH